MKKKPKRGGGGSVHRRRGEIENCLKNVGFRKEKRLTKKGTEQEGKKYKGSQEWGAFKMVLEYKKGTRGQLVAKERPEGVVKKLWGLTKQKPGKGRFCCTGCIWGHSVGQKQKTQEAQRTQGVVAKTGGKKKGGFLEKHCYQNKRDNQANLKAVWGE